MPELQTSEAQSEASPAQSEMQPAQPSLILLAVRTFSTTVIWAALVFVSAGNLHWRRGWATVAVYIVTMALIGVIVNRLNPGLLAQRAKWNKKGAPAFDRTFLAVFIPLTFAQIVVAGLDAGRFHWLPLARWTFFLGVALFWVAMGVVQWALLVNPFAEPVVRIQTERSHRVISAGPYRYVRHPMYVGTVLMYPATAWMFGSGWAMGIAGIIALMFIWRTAREDRYLRANLEGYSAFAAQTHYRLLPGVW